MAKDFSKGQQTTIDRKRAQSLLFPITTFLRAGGLSRKEAESIFSSLYRKPFKLGVTRKIDHIGNPTHYADIVALWTRDQRFVDKTGGPRPLSLHGVNSLSTLVREASPRTKLNAILPVLTRYRTVRYTKRNKYELVIPYFFTTGQRRIAFEPAAYFLSDASATLGRLLKVDRPSAKPHLFWRKVENTKLSRETAKLFMTFIRNRSITFLEEIDDWLEAHSKRKNKTPNNGKQHRVGLGLFSYAD